MIYSEVIVGESLQFHTDSFIGFNLIISVGKGFVFDFIIQSIHFDRRWSYYVSNDLFVQLKNRNYQIMGQSVSHEQDVFNAADR